VNDNNHFYRVFKGTGCLHWCARRRYFVVCKQLCLLSARYVTASEYKVRALSIIISFMRTGLWLGAEKDVCFVSCESIDSELYTHGVSSEDELCDVHERRNSSGEEKRKNVTLNQSQVLPKSILLTKLLNYYFPCTALPCIMNKTLCP
jgi:hypothetical protein